MSSTNGFDRCWGKAARAFLYTVLFVASFLVFDRLVFLGVRRGADRYYASLGTTALQFSKGTFFGSGDGDLLIFGSSRARYAFAQDILSSRLNKRVVKEAAAGKFPKYNHYFYQKYRRTFPRPRAVIYGLDYFMFEKDSDSSELARFGRDIKLSALDPGGRVNPTSPLLSRVSSLYRMKPAIDRFLGDMMKFDRAAEDDDAAPVKKWPGRKKRLTAHRIRRTNTVKPDSWQTRTYQVFPGREGSYLLKLLSDLKNDAVPVFLVIIPDYIGANDTNFEQDKFKADIRSLAAPFENVRLLDFNRPDRFDLDDPKFFWDGAWGKSNCHLSLKGMLDFSGRLAAELKRAFKDVNTGAGPGKEPAT